MTEQLFTLDSSAETALTGRQAHALEVIRRHQPVRSDILGAHLHAYRRANGGRGHGADTFCEWCTSEGRSVGEALHKRGLARYVLREGWRLASNEGVTSKSSSQLDANDPWPKGF